MKKRLSTQQGFLMLVAVLFIIVIGFLGVVATYLLVNSANSTTNQTQATKALYLAESGLEHATHTLFAFTLSNRTACSRLNIHNSLGEGEYTVSSGGPFYVSSPSTITGATLSVSATNIPVTSTANYQPAGRIMIDRELINYSAIVNNQFIGVERGVDGTIAEPHAVGTPVGQYQCHLSAQGGVPHLTIESNNPGGKRILQEDIQLQAGWAVGDHVIAQWNYPTESAWSGLNTTDSIHAISMISYADGWAVGAAGHFLHWTGTPLGWASINLLPSVDYYDIYCNASNDCHAVGAPSDNTATILDWNGTTWLRAKLDEKSTNHFLKAIHCDASNDCWAIGDIFYHYDGNAWTRYAESTLTGFNSVFCNSSTDCWAAGSNATFAHYNGTTWTPMATGMPDVKYNSVYCNSSNDCWAAGNNSVNDVIIHWNGIAWSRDTSNPTPVSDLNSVRCTGPNDCWAVGSTVIGHHPAFVHYDGASWTSVAVTSLPENTVLHALDFIHPNRQPEAQWREMF